MAYAEKLVKSWRACWYVPGRKSAVKESGFPSERAARKYAEEQEVKARIDAEDGYSSSDMTFEAFAKIWYAKLKLEPNTMRAYKSMLEHHLLRVFGDYTLVEMNKAGGDVSAWEAGLIEAGYKAHTARLIRMLLHTICGDAIEAGLMKRNPASQKRSRGRVSDRRRARREAASSHPIANPLRALLAAERCAILSKRDDEFIMVVLGFWAGLRWCELRGVRIDGIRPKLEVHHQLARWFYWKEPKDGSVRDLDVPPFLAGLLRIQAEQVRHPDPPEDQAWCPCGAELDDEYRHDWGIHLFAGRNTWHPAGNLFAAQLWHPSVSGRTGGGALRPIYVNPRVDGSEIKPLDIDPRKRRWPADAIACWAPLMPGMTPHGMRHTHRSWLSELHVPRPLALERLGHVDSTTSGQYDHPTEEMRADMLKGLEKMFWTAVEQRRQIQPTSEVRIVARLLEEGRGMLHSRFTPDAPRRLTAVTSELTA